MLAQIVGPTFPKCQLRIRIKESGSRIRIKDQDLGSNTVKRGSSCLPIRNCQSWPLPAGDIAYLHELCTHRLLPLLGCRSQISSLTPLSIPHSAAEKDKTAAPALSLLLSSSSSHRCTRNTVLNIFVRNFFSSLWWQNVFLCFGKLLYFLLVPICICARSSIQPYPRWPASALQLIVESFTCIYILFQCVSLLYSTFDVLLFLFYFSSNLFSVTAFSYFCAFCFLIHTAKFIFHQV